MILRFKADCEVFEPLLQKNLKLLQEIDLYNVSGSLVFLTLVASDTSMRLIMIDGSRQLPTPHADEASLNFISVSTSNQFPHSEQHSSLSCVP
jgi:hypothetical protein